MTRIIVFVLTLFLFNIAAPHGEGMAQPLATGPDIATSHQEKQQSLFQTVTPEEAQALMASHRDLLVVDVRNQDELREGYIEGSTLIPLWDIVKGQQNIPRDRPVLLICAVGGRSLALGKLMVQNGWPEIYNLKGGIEAWKEAGLPLKY